MNVPGRPDGDWRWRYSEGMLSPSALNAGSAFFCGCRDQRSSFDKVSSKVRFQTKVQDMHYCGAALLSPISRTGLRLGFAPDRVESRMPLEQGGERHSESRRRSRPPNKQLRTHKKDALINSWRGQSVGLSTRRASSIWKPVGKACYRNGAAGIKTSRELLFVKFVPNS